MTFLPIVERELRVAARRRSTYWTRMAMSGAAVATMGWMLDQWGWRLSQAQIGIRLFGICSLLGFGYCALAGVFVTADSISAEKREGTLGLLFLTDLSGYDVVLGKLAATSLNTFYGVLAVFPVLAVPLLLGGVTPGEFWRMAAVLLNTLFLSLSVGMLVSSVSRNERSAFAAALGLMVALVLGPPLLASLLLPAANPAGVMPGVWQLTPYQCYLRAFETAYYTTPSQFFLSLLLVHILGWLLLGLASWIVPRSWQEKTAIAALPSPQQWKYGTAAVRAAHRQKLLAVNPVTWLAGRDRRQRQYVWLFLAVSTFVWLWGYRKFGPFWVEPSVCGFVAYALHAVLKVWVAAEAGLRLGAERRSGALEVLLSTPLGVNEIIRGNVLALKRQFAGPILAVLAMDGLLLWLCLTQGSTSAEVVNRVSVFLVFIAIFIADVLALAWAGLWFGFKSKHGLAGGGFTLARMVVLPWIIVSPLFLIGLLQVHGLPWLLVWTGFGAFTDLMLGLNSGSSLHEQFRRVASSDPEIKEPDSEWERSLQSDPGSF